MLRCHVGTRVYKVFWDSVCHCFSMTMHDTANPELGVELLSTFKVKPTHNEFRQEISYHETWYDLTESETRIGDLSTLIVTEEE